MLIPRPQSLYVPPADVSIPDWPLRVTCPPHVHDVHAYAKLAYACILGCWLFFVGACGVATSQPSRRWEFEAGESCRLQATCDWCGRYLSLAMHGRRLLLVSGRKRWWRRSSSSSSSTRSMIDRKHRCVQPAAACEKHMHVYSVAGAGRQTDVQIRRVAYRSTTGSIGRARSGRGTMHALQVFRCLICGSQIDHVRPVCRTHFCYPSHSISRVQSAIHLQKASFFSLFIWSRARLGEF